MSERMAFPGSVPGHPMLPPGEYLIDGYGIHGVINPRKVPNQSTEEEEVLLPWQRAVLRLYNGEAVEWGEWTWRQYRLPDGARQAQGTSEGLLVMQVALLRTGDEYALSVWRPRARDGRSPAGYRLALVTWGDYLDMTRDDVYDKMNRDHAPSS